MPIFDIEPGTLPETAGVMRFYRQGAADDSGMVLSSDGNLTLAGVLAAAGGTNLTGAAVGTDVLTAAVTGDTQKRFILNAGGGIDLGGGSGIVDTNLYRGGANLLQTDSSLTVGGNLLVSGIGQFRRVAKGSALNRNTTITPADDPDLTLSVAANATYEVRCLAAWTNGGGGFRMCWNVPAAATMTWTDGGGSGMVLPTTNATFTASTGTEAVGQLITGANAGACTLQWAQSTSNAANTSLQAGSFLSLRRTA